MTRANQLNEWTEHLLRDIAPQVLTVVARRFRDFAGAEDAVQEALIFAAMRWPEQGVPQNPRAWLIRVAMRRMMDWRRSDEARQDREDEFGADAELAQPEMLEPEMDDTLNLFFMCCHPMLTAPSSIALTLRALGGLTTTEIAHAFLVPEATMAQRISRAKATIKASGVRLESPAANERGERLQAVLHVLYLIFSEGYTASSGAELQRLQLSSEAIRLARALHALLPDDPEVTGLLALMLLTDARRAARSTPEGDPIPLDKQDRSLWDQTEIAEGDALLRTALSGGATGHYKLQAAIAALHDDAPTAAETDWPQILALYELMLKLTDSPVVALNRAVAAAMVDGPARGLELLAGMDSDPRLTRSHRLDAVRGHLLEMAGDFTGAAAQYRLAAQRTMSAPEQRYLSLQAARVSCG